MSTMQMVADEMQRMRTVECRHQNSWKLAPRCPRLSSLPSNEENMSVTCRYAAKGGVNSQESLALSYDQKFTERFAKAALD